MKIVLHPDLKVNGKKISDIEQLESFFTLECFDCNIGYFFLQIEYAKGGAAFIGWIDEYHDEIFYFDNESGNIEPVPLRINVCPEERMMCYDDKSIRAVVCYFCETGQRNPSYHWIEDER